MQAELVFLLARAREDQVRVRVDQARGDDAARRVDDRGRGAGIGRQDGGARAHGGDAVAPDRHRAIGHDAQLALRGAAARAGRARQGDDLGSAGDDQAGGTVGVRGRVGHAGSYRAATRHGAAASPVL